MSNGSQSGNVDVASVDSDGSGEMLWEEPIPPLKDAESTQRQLATQWQSGTRPREQSQKG